MRVTINARGEHDCIACIQYHEAEADMRSAAIYQATLRQSVMSILLADSQTVREIFRAHLNDLVGFLQRVDNLKFIANVLPTNLEQASQSV